MEAWISLSIGSSHNKQLSPLPVLLPNLCRARSGEVSPWQGQGDCQHIWQPSEECWPSGYNLQAETLACQLFCGVLVLYTQDTDVSSPKENQEIKSRKPVMIPYIVEMSKYNKHVCRKFDIRVVSRSEQILYSRLAGSRICYPWINSPVWCTASPDVVARSALERQRQKTRAKEHQDAYERKMTEVSHRGASIWRISPYHWEETLECVKEQGKQGNCVLTKKATYIQMRPS